MMDVSIKILYFSLYTFQIIKELRCQRLHMIQTAPQYVFLHVCLIELLASEGILKKNRHHKSFITNYKVSQNHFHIFLQYILEILKQS